MTQSIYLDKELRARLIRHAAKQEVKLGERVSVNSIIVSAIEAWLATYGGGSGEGDPSGSLSMKEEYMGPNETLVAELFRCPRCKAKKDERCSTPGGRYREPHRERVHAAMSGS